MTGIFPFNPAAVDQRKLKAGEIFQHNQNTSEETVVLRESVVSVAQASAPPEDSVLLASGEEEGAVVLSSQGSVHMKKEVLDQIQGSESFIPELCRTGSKNKSMNLNISSIN